MNVKDIPISDIKIVENVRVKIEKLEGLMQDIKQHGLYHAIKVAKTKTNEYVLVQGNRRLMACKKLGWKKIPANISEDMDLAELLIHNMAENVHREEITPIELGRICTRLEKELDLTQAEISARLSIPMGRIKAGLSAYTGMPDKYRKRIVFTGKGNGRNGNIPATVAMKIMTVKRNNGLSDAAVDKLLSISRMQDYGAAELHIISLLLDQGSTVTQAVEQGKRYKYLRVDTIVDNEEIESLLAKYKIDQRQALLNAILYGELPPLKRPSWFKAKQVPVKG